MFVVNVCFVWFVVFNVFVGCGVAVVVVRCLGQRALTNCSGRAGRPAFVMHPVYPVWDDAVGVCVLSRQTYTIPENSLMGGAGCLWHAPMRRVWHARPNQV